MIGPGCYRTLAYSTGGAEMNTVGKTGETTSQRCRLKSYGPAARIVCAVSCPLAGAASTVPISGPALGASPEKNMAPPSGFLSTDCASRVLGVA
jgi:hypothetical protein